MNPVLGQVDVPAMPLLVNGDVCTVGQPIVAIVAESETAALDAAERTEMDLTPLEPVCNTEPALVAPALFPELSGNTMVDESWHSGDAARAFAGAAEIAEVTIWHPRVATAQLERRATVAA